MSIFRSRNIESKDSRDSSVEKCELKLLYPSEDAAECQLLIRLICKHGVRKTYKLQYESSSATMHAIIDKTTTHNRFIIAARAMKEVMDHFAPRAEELTLTVSAGSLLLTSFTEGVVSDREVLKQPVHTSISIEDKEFDFMEVDEDIQITFGLREFKALGGLCDLLSTELSVHYSDAGKPLLVEFEKDGMTGEFIVATTADGERISRDAQARPPRNAAAGGQYAPRTITADVAVDHGRADGDASYSQHHEGLREAPRWNLPVTVSAHALSRTTSRQSSRHASAMPTNIQGREGDDVDAASRPHENGLFMPDPDLQDDDLQAGRSHNASGLQSGSNREADPAVQKFEAEVEEDEMELYADELNFEPEPMTFGPTQTQSREKPRGLFD